MMTSSSGNNFRVTGHLCREFTGHRWIPRTKASDAELWCFSLICAVITDWVNNRVAGDLRRHRAHYDVTVMICWHWNDADSRSPSSWKTRNSLTYIFNVMTGDGLVTQSAKHIWIKKSEKIRWTMTLNSSSPRQNGCHFGRRQFRMYFLEWKW